MRWLVVGARGGLGTDLVAALESGGRTVTAVGRDRLDVTDPGRTMDVVGGHDVVVNCAAFTGVDAAEAQEPDAFAVNAVGAANLARATRRHGARLVHLSTDYVFDGEASAPYAEDAPPAPRSAYGRTKAAGEWAAAAEASDLLLVRTAWLYGAHGACFPRTIVRLARERGGVDVVDDQRGQPTWTADVADLILRLVDAGVAPGTYHATSSGDASWFEFARAVVEAAGLDPAIVRPTSSESFARPAPRPAWSVLGHGTLRSAGIEPIGPWRERWSAAASRVLDAG